MESVKNNKMDEQMKAKFDNFAPPVPTDLWNKIESQLDVGQPIKMMPVKRIRSSFFIYGGAVAATLLVAFAFWKFSGQEAIVLKGSPKVYASKPLSEATGLTQVDKKGEQQAHQGSILDVNPIAAAKKSIKVAEKVAPNPQSVEIKLATEANVEHTQGELDYHAIYAESAFSIASTEEPIVTLDVLPFESEIIALQESTSLQENSQDNLNEEIIPSKNKKIGVSTVLNFLAKGLSNESGKSIEFSESEEGILKLDLKLGFAKSND